MGTRMWKSESAGRRAVRCALTRLGRRRPLADIGLPGTVGLAAGFAAGALLTMWWLLPSVPEKSAKSNLALDPTPNKLDPVSRKGIKQDEVMGAP
jgi:hypothetical protein